MISQSLLLLCMTVGPTLAAGQGVPQSVPPGDSGSQVGTSTTLSPGAGPATSAAPSSPNSPPATGTSFFDALEHRGFVGMLLDHRAELQLAAKQLTALSALEQVFRAQADSATRQLDSVRKANSRLTNGLSLRNANATQLGALLQSQQTMAVLVQRVLTVQQQTKQRALVLLTPAQRTQAAALEKQMRQLLNTTLHPKGQGNQPPGPSPQSPPVPAQSAH